MGQVSTSNPEADGIIVVEDPPPEEEEPPPENEDDENPEPKPEPTPPLPPKYPNPGLDFQVQTKMTVTLSALPADVASLLAVATCFNESGLKHVKSTFLRVVDTTYGGEGEEKEKDVARVAVHSAVGADVDSTCVVLGMVQRALHGNAVWRWRGAGGDSGSLEEFVFRADLREAVMVPMLASFNEVGW